jgi:hypothetical protein
MPLIGTEVVGGLFDDFYVGWLNPDDMRALLESREALLDAGVMIAVHPEPRELTELPEFATAHRLELARECRRYDVVSSPDEQLVR